MSISVRMVCPLALASLISIGLPGIARPSLRHCGASSPGSHAVGFRTLWQLDYSRRYNTTFDDKTTYAPGKAPRPILMNVWYPATQAGDAKSRHTAST